MKRLLLILLLTTSAAEAKTIEIGERPGGYVNLHIAIAKQWKLLKYNVVLEGNQLSAAAISVVYFKRIGGKICAKPNVRLWFHEGALGTKPNEFYLKQTVKTGWHEPEEFGIGTCPDKRNSKVKVMRCGHFDSYCVFIDGKPGEIGKGIVDTLNSDNISVEVDGDEDGIRAWDENGRRVVEYIAAFDPPATLALIAEVERLRAEAETIRDLVLSEAAKVANEKRDEYEEECTVEWQASNDQQSIIAGAKADACVAVAAAILTLTGEK